MSGEELRALAEQATRGPWAAVHSAYSWVSAEPSHRPVAGIARPADAAFIAAANPTAVLALLDERDALRAQVERVEMIENTWLASASVAPEHMRAVFLSAAEDLRAALEDPQ